MKTREFKVTVPFEGLYDPKTGFGCLRNVDAVAGAYGSEAAVRSDLRVHLLSTVKPALRCFDERFSRTVIGTNDGEVLTVANGGHDWFYRVDGPNRSHHSAHHGAWESREDAEAAAREHAEASYGGVAWESR